MSPETPSPARRLLAEPYRILFPLAVVAGMLGVGHWLAYAAGWSGAYSGSFHAACRCRSTSRRSSPGS